MGRIAGIPVSARWSVVVILALIMVTLAGGVLPQAAPGQARWIYWAAALPTAPVFLACLLAHELAHCVLAQRQGVGVRSIVLFAFGGVSELLDEPPGPRADFLIAAAGPLTSLALGLFFGIGGVAVALTSGPALMAAILLWLGLINAFLAVFNLLPGAPLDGGRVLRAFLWWRYHDRDRAAETAARAGIGIGYGLAAVGLFEAFLGDSGGIWLALIGWFLTIMARAEAMSVRIRRLFGGVHVGDVMQTRFDVVPASETAQDCAEHLGERPARRPVMVVETDGHPVGTVRSDVIAHLRPGRRARPVREIMTALPDRNVTTPGAPATALFTAPPADGLVVAAVVEAGETVGMITTADLDEFVRHRLARPADDRP
ncbi:site-2 protease family protein [Actinocorallia aurea]